MGASKSSSSAYIYEPGLTEHIERPGVEPLVEWYMVERDGFSSEEWMSVWVKLDTTTEEIRDILECQEWYRGDLNKVHLLDDELNTRLHRVIPDGVIAKDLQEVKERLKAEFTEEEIKEFRRQLPPEVLRELREMLERREK